MKHHELKSDSLLKNFPQQRLKTVEVVTYRHFPFICKFTASVMRHEEECLALDRAQNKEEKRNKTTPKNTTTKTTENFANWEYWEYSRMFIKQSEILEKICLSVNMFLYGGRCFGSQEIASPHFILAFENSLNSIMLETVAYKFDFNEPSLNRKKNK